MKTQKTKVEEFLTSLQAITAPLLVLMLGYSVKVALVLYESIDFQSELGKIVVSALLGIAGGWSMLNFNVNKQFIDVKAQKAIKIILIGCSLAMYTFVFNVFEIDETIPRIQRLRGVFLSLLFTGFEWLYMEMYLKRMAQAELSKNIDELNVKAATLEKELKVIKAENTKLKKRNKDLVGVNANLKSSVSQISSYERAMLNA